MALNIVWFLLCVMSLAQAKLIDLEDAIQDFVLETKQITIPGYRGAFNACVVQWQDSFLMSFRVRDEHMVSTFQIGLVRLDKNFNPISEPHILKIYDNPSSYVQLQDPRLMVINNRLYMLYSNFIKIDDMVTRRMFIAELHCDEHSFYIKSPLCIDPFEESSKRWEKNWTPFNYQERLLLIYSMLPHKIFEPSLITGSCARIASTHSSIDWKWGQLRGGTQAIYDNGQYISFFHSSVIMASVHSQGKKMQHYVMGAYTFSPQPPFQITSISPEPIVGKNFYYGAEYPTWKPLRVVFPMGIIADEEYFWITYGRQDFEIWVAKIDKKKLYASLVPTPALTSVQYAEQFKYQKEQRLMDYLFEDDYETYLDTNIFNLS